MHSSVLAQCNEAIRVFLTVTKLQEEKPPFSVNTDHLAGEQDSLNHGNLAIYLKYSYFTVFFKFSNKRKSQGVLNHSQLRQNSLKRAFLALLPCFRKNQECWHDELLLPSCHPTLNFSKLIYLEKLQQLPELNVSCVVMDCQGKVENDVSHCCTILFFFFCLPVSSI